MTFPARPPSFTGARTHSRSCLSSCAENQDIRPNERTYLTSKRLRGQRRISRPSESERYQSELGHQVLRKNSRMGFEYALVPPYFSPPPPPQPLDSRCAMAPSTKHSYPDLVPPPLRRGKWVYGSIMLFSLDAKLLC